LTLAKKVLKAHFIENINATDCSATGALSYAKDRSTMSLLRSHGAKVIAAPPDLASPSTIIKTMTGFKRLSLAFEIDIAIFRHNDPLAIFPLESYGYDDLSSTGKELLLLTSIRQQRLIVLKCLLKRLANPSAIAFISRASALELACDRLPGDKGACCANH
jgi:hypothetical protein